MRVAWLVTAVLGLAAVGNAQAAPRRPVCLVTDYGTSGFYVGAIKSAILQKNPDAAIHDLTHELPAYDIQAGAFILHQATAFLPAGAIVVAVVDPGVGTLRRNIAVKTRRGITYVGPDNGLFTWVIREQGLAEVRDITHPSARLDATRSSTFHGRDIYGPAAGWMSAGHDTSELGSLIKDPVTFPVTAAETRPESVVGQVLLVDHYGNIFTNIPKAMMEGAQQPDPADANRRVLQVRFAGGATALFPVGVTYATVKANTEVAVVNSLGLAELALNQGNAGTKYAVKAGQRVELLLKKP